MDRATAPALIERDRDSVRLLVYVCVPAIIALVIAGLQDAVDPGTLLRDPATTTDQPATLGLFSSLGVIAWNIAWVVLAGSAYLLHRAGASGRLVGFTAYGAILTAALMLDDLFLGHESAGRQGVPQTLIFGLYATAALVWAFKYRDQLRATPITVLGAAAMLFGTSLAIDLAFESSDAKWRILSEDGAKFLAILALAVWAASSARQMLVPRVGFPALNFLHHQGAGSDPGELPKPEQRRAPHPQSAAADVRLASPGRRLNSRH